MMMMATPQVLLLEYLPRALAGTSSWVGLACSSSTDVEGKNRSWNGGRPPGGYAPKVALLGFTSNHVGPVEFWIYWYEPAIPPNIYPDGGGGWCDVTTSPKQVPGRSVDPDSHSIGTRREKKGRGSTFHTRAQQLQKGIERASADFYKRQYSACQIPVFRMVTVYITL